MESVSNETQSNQEVSLEHEFLTSHRSLSVFTIPKRYHEILLLHGLIDFEMIQWKDITVMLMPFIQMIEFILNPGTFGIQEFKYFEEYFCFHLAIRYAKVLMMPTNSQMFRLLHARVQLALDECLFQTSWKETITELNLEEDFENIIQPILPNLSVSDFTTDYDQLATRINSFFCSINETDQYLGLIVDQFRGYHLRYGKSNDHFDLTSYFRGVPYDDALSYLSGSTLGDFLILFLRREETNQSESSLFESGSNTPNDASLIHTPLSSDQASNGDNQDNSPMYHSTSLVTCLSRVSSHLDTLRLNDASHSVETLNQSNRMVNPLDREISIQCSQEPLSVIQTESSALNSDMTLFLETSVDGSAEWSGIVRKIRQFSIISEYLLFRDSYRFYKNYEKDLIRGINDGVWHV